MIAHLFFFNFQSFPLPFNFFENLIVEYKIVCKHLQLVTYTAVYIEPMTFRMEKLTLSIFNVYQAGFELQQ